MDIIDKIKEYLFNTAEHTGENKNIEDWYLLQTIEFINKLEVCKDEQQPETTSEHSISHGVSKRKFNLNELRHIAVNFAITCEKGYRGDFDSWLNGISGEWRKIANRK